MAITKNPLAADAPAPYTVTRAFFWAGGVVAVDSVVQLTKADAAALLAANKVTPGEPVEKPAAKKQKAKTKAEADADAEAKAKADADAKADSTNTAVDQDGQPPEEVAHVPV